MLNIVVSVCAGASLPRHNAEDPYKVPLSGLPPSSYPPMRPTTTMHRCLQIVELQNQIFEYCADLGLGSIAALARTCQAFRESALEILWRELEDVSPFVKMLPSHIWREVKTTNKSGQTVITLVSEHRMMT